MKATQSKKNKVKQQLSQDVFIEDVSAFLVNFYRERGFVEFRKLVKSFYNSFQKKDEKVAKRLVDLLNNEAYETYALTVKEYFIKVLLSKDYQHFKKTTPMELVRMVRYYLGRKGKSFPLKMVPFLAKLARKVKYNLSKQILTLSKKEPLREEEDVFNEVKGRILKKTLLKQRKKKES